jgi:lipoate-protein ligase A
MGIGGKPEELLELDKIRQDQIVTIKRFTGGGTVVVDPECIWTSIIGRKGKATTTVKEISRLVRMDQVEAFPRPIMEWTAQAVFEPLFEQLNLLHKQTSPTFQLLENDYVLTSADDDHQQRRKMGGNAQAIVREGWLHHTSFLWTYKSMGYLKLPKKRPNYRADREHSDFLLQLQQVYPNAQKEQFYDSLRLVCQDQFDLQVVDWDRALEYVEKRGGMDALYKTSRTRVLTDL